MFDFIMYTKQLLYTYIFVYIIIFKTYYKYIKIFYIYFMQYNYTSFDITFDHSMCNEVRKM